MRDSSRLENPSPVTAQGSRFGVTRNGDRRRSQRMRLRGNPETHYRLRRKRQELGQPGSRVTRPKGRCLNRRAISNWVRKLTCEMKVKSLPCCKLLDDLWYQPFIGKARAQSMVGIVIALLPIWCTKSTQVVGTAQTRSILVFRGL
jgi:hypothetical protein